MKLVLIVGTPETGVSALRRWFAANREALTQRGIRYPMAGAAGQDGHHRLAFYGREYDKEDAAFAGIGVKSAEQHEALRSRLRHNLETEAVEFSGSATWVMASEQIYSRLNNWKSIRRLADLVTPLFEQVTVYLHLRPQVDLLIANAALQLARGQELSEANLGRAEVRPGNRFYGYEGSVSLWEQCFGAEAIRLVPYRRQPDLTKVLIEALNIDPTGLTQRSAPATLPDWRALALSAAARKGFNPRGLTTAPLSVSAEKLPGNAPIQPGRAFAKSIHDRFASSNQQLCERRSDITPKDLTPDWSAYSEESNLDQIALLAGFSDQIGEILRGCSAAITAESLLRFKAEARVAELSGDAAGLEEAQKLAAAAEEDLRRLTAD